MSSSAQSMFTPAAMEIANHLGLKMGKANLDQFALSMAALAKVDRNVLAVTSDSRGSGKLAPFGQAFPEQIVEVGIAEQNLVGVAAGLASCGKRVFAVSPACFLTARSLEQIKNDVCYSDFPVAVVGISAGVSYGALGTTHHSLHDIAALRAVNNIRILVPADNAEAAMAVKDASSMSSPTYIRFGKAPLYDLPNAVAIEVGRARLVRDGNDVAFIASGEATIHALLAAEALSMQGISARVMSFHSIRPLDKAAIINAAKSCRAIVVVEEHHMHGGLGDAVASTLLSESISPRFCAVGIPDEYCITGSQADIFRHYGISMEGLSRTMLRLI